MKRVALLPVIFFLLAPAAAEAQKAPAIRKKDTSDTLAVKGPVRLELELRAGPVEVVRGKTNQVSAVLRDGTGRSVKVVQSNGAVSLLIDGDDDIESADLRISLPAKSSIKIENVAGDVTVADVGGDVDIEAISGKVQVRGASKVEVETVSGAIWSDDNLGSVAVSSVSGDVKIQSKISGRTEVETVSGNIDFRGLCANECKMEIESLSGEVHLGLAAKSSFEVEFETFSGSLHDNLGLGALEKSGSPGRGMEYGGFFNKQKLHGEIECETHSGSLRLMKE